MRHELLLRFDMPASARRSAMRVRFPRRRRFIAAFAIGLGFASASLAYDPEIGTTLSAFPIMQAGGHAFDWKPDGFRYRILIVGASWCPPCQEFRTSLPIELSRIRQLGIPFSAIFVEADGFGPGASRIGSQPGPNGWGYVEAVPDPARIDLAKESPKGVRDWGAFRTYGYPTTFLLDPHNVVIERYRGSSSSGGVFNDLIAHARRTGAVGRVPAQPSMPPRVPPPEPKAATSLAQAIGDRAIDQAGDELIGLWRIDNPEAKDPRPLFLRVIGVNATDAGPLQLEASLSFKLTKWVPVEARCERAVPSCVLRVTTAKGGQLTVKRQSDGSYAGEIVYGRNRSLVRPITLAPMSLDEADL